MADVNSDNQGIDNLRNAYEELKAQHETLQTQHRELQVSTTFKEVGLNPKHAPLFLKATGDGEISAKTVKQFAEEYDLMPVPTQEGAPQEEGGITPPDANEVPDPGLANMAGAGTQATGAAAPGALPGKMEREAFQKLLESNPAEALKAYREGRVETVEGNEFVDRARRDGQMR